MSAKRQRKMRGKDRDERMTEKMSHQKWLREDGGHKEREIRRTRKKGEETNEGFRNPNS